ncbi:MAG: cation-translocating P-type ATPase [Eubacteriales bacterium]|nr:cation-translocating P-type ATPase [Eubacteriales bacterium]
MDKKFYLETAEAVLKETQASPEGLSQQEAESRLEKNGPNKLADPEKESLLKRFFDQMKDPMIIILICAAGISALLDILEHSVPYDTFIILFVVIVNAVLGVVQESKAEAAIEALQSMSAATTKTLRDGKICDIKSQELVVGDVILLEAGDSVPADCRILEAASMKVEEAALTGESTAVSKLTEALSLDGGKDVALGDRKNMAYLGSTVVYGRGRAVVTGTGMDTEMGKIADAISQAKDGLTPLQIKLEQLSHTLTKLVVGICIFIFAFNIVEAWIRGNALNLETVLDFFMVAVSLAVAAIPEGLVAVVTIVLSIGVTNMSKKNAIIRKLTAVETLGCTQIICSDKTGTLTQNKMTVVEEFTKDKILLAKAMALCSDAELEEDGSVKGEPTEAALVAFAAANELPKYSLKKEQPRIGEAPFDSMRKMMSTVHETKEGIFQYTKGAPDEILSRCTKVWNGEKEIPMTKELRDEILAANKSMADRALRVLAASFRSYGEAPFSYEAGDLEKDLVFVGLCGMIDPVRPEVKDAIDQCREAGIRPIMITGDHKDTAVAIAKELGIISDASQAITGAELNDMDDETFRNRIQEIFVYSRVQPEHKTRIVNMWRNLGYVTAMTGDGVNDAPSIKSADIGIGMGITGTDVTKNVADMVLADDNFATIVAAAREGRRIYDNIRKAIQFLLSSNLSEVLSIFFASLLGLVILKPTHLLFINLITDCFPALALGIEHPEKNIMHRKPRKTGDGIFAGGLGVDVVYQGVAVTVLTMIAYFIGRAGDPAVVNGESSLGITMAFFTMSMCEIFHSINMRSQRESLFSLERKNMPLFGAMVASFLLTTAVVEIPALASMFDFAQGGLDLFHYLVSFGLAISIIPIVELVKLIQRRVGKE